MSNGYQNQDGTHFPQVEDRSEIVIARLRLRLIEEVLHKYDPANRRGPDGEGFNCVMDHSPMLIDEIREILRR